MNLSTSTPPPAAEPGSAILAEIAAGVVADDDLRALLERFLDPIVQLAGARAGAVRTLSEDGSRLQLLSTVGLPQGLGEHEVAVDRHCGHCGNAADGAAPVWATDLRACAEHSPGAFFGRAGTRLLAVPLRHRERTLGVYNLFYDAGAGEPSAGTLAMLKSIGELLGLALNNARLEQEHLRASLRQERQWMAAEVHDSIAQQLAFVKMRMPLLHDALLAHDEARALGYYGDVRSAVTQAHASLRGLLTHLRAPVDPLGLAHALEVCAANFRRACGAEIEWHNELGEVDLGPEQEAQVFHIVQEALHNIARHAAARQVRLHIARGEDGESIEVLVEDDGVGLPGASAPGHFGLEIMAERARRIGGTLEVGPRAGGGTCVRLRFPAGAAAPQAVEAA
jgi:two-component system, NarL family, nitrate/nitrite sensor histidine kinase NarX